MSVTVMAEVWRLDLPKAEKLVLLAFADHAHDDGSKSHPGIARLRYKTGLSETAVHRALNGLRDAGLLVAEAYATGGRGRATEYRVVTVAGTRLADFEEWRAINAPRKGTETGTVSVLGPTQKGVKNDLPTPKRVPKSTRKGAAGGTPTIIEPSVREPSVRVAAKKPRTPAQQKLDTLAEALITACNYERATITEPLWGQLRKAASI